jgi:hypothetical protein
LKKLGEIKLIMVEGEDDQCTGCIFQNPYTECVLFARGPASCEDDTTGKAIIITEEQYIKVKIVERG